MEKIKMKFCPAMWFSGFFGFGALVHAIRFVTRFDIAVNGQEIPLSASGVLALVFGIFSIGLLILSLKKPCESGKENVSTCCK